MMSFTSLFVLTFVSSLYWKPTGAKSCSTGLTCWRYPCPTGSKCVPDPNIQCVRAPCKQRRCVRPNNPCQIFPCPKGQLCVPNPNIRCVTTPCPMRECIASPCDRYPCPTGEKCVPDPNIQCKKLPCKHRRCVPLDNPCQRIDCSENHPRCEVTIQDGQPVGRCVVQDPCQLVRCLGCKSYDTVCQFRPNCPKKFKCGVTNDCQIFPCPEMQFCVPNPNIRCITTPCPQRDCFASPCDTVRCGSDRPRCQVDLVDGTSRASCQPQNPCILALCPNETECTLQTVQCLVPPCPVVAKCLPAKGCKVKCTIDKECVRVVKNGIITYACLPRESTCAATLCQTGSSCVETSTNGRTTARCVATGTKPGSCPVVSPGQVGICVHRCSLDKDCSGSKKCCSNGCGKTCKDPTQKT